MDIESLLYSGDRERERKSEIGVTPDMLYSQSSAIAAVYRPHYTISYKPL